MTDLEWAFAATIATLAAARITGLFVHDSFPPTQALRTWYLNKTNGNQWSVLMVCIHCFGVWAAGWVVGTGLLSLWLLGDLHWTWWALHGWLAVSLAAVMVLNRVAQPQSIIQTGEVHHHHSDVTSDGR